MIAQVFKLAQILAFFLLGRSQENFNFLSRELEGGVSTFKPLETLGYLVSTSLTMSQSPTTSFNFAAGFKFENCRIKLQPFPLCHRTARVTIQHNRSA